MTGEVAAVAVDVVRISDRTCWIFVTLADDEGNAGIGEASLQGREDVVVTAVRNLAPGVLGAPAAPFPGSAFAPCLLPEAAAASAIDQALWDLAARRVGRSVASLAGGERRSGVPEYANINRRTHDRSPEGFARSARDALGAGHAAFKIAPFDEVVPAAHAEGRVEAAAALGLARAAAVRDAVGPGRPVMIDCHWRFDEPSAAAMIRRAGELGLAWVECPIVETVANIPAIRRLRSLANERGMRLAGCEELVGIEAFRPFIEAGAYDVLMPDVKYCGGIGEMLRIAEVMARRGVAFSPHNPSGPVCHAASLQVCAAVPGMDRLEVQFDESPLFTTLLREDLAPVETGSEPVPPGPGLAVTLDGATVAATRVGGWTSRAGFP